MRREIKEQKIIGSFLFWKFVKEFHLIHGSALTHDGWFKLNGVIKPFIRNTKAGGEVVNAVGSFGLISIGYKAGVLLDKIITRPLHRNETMRTSAPHDSDF